MKTKKFYLGIALMASLGMFSSCEDWIPEAPSPQTTITITNSVSTLKCEGENVLNIDVKTDNSLVTVNVDADTTKIAREDVNEVYCAIGVKSNTFTELPITLKDSLAESGSYTLRIVVKYTKDGALRESTYTGSLTVTSKTTTE